MPNVSCYIKREDLDTYLIIKAQGEGAWTEWIHQNLQDSSRLVDQPLIVRQKEDSTPEPNKMSEALQPAAKLTPANIVGEESVPKPKMITLEDVQKVFPGAEATTAEDAKTFVPKPPDPETGYPCCTNEKKPCKHWSWDGNYSYWINELTGKTREALMA